MNSENDSCTDERNYIEQAIRMVQAGETEKYRMIVAAYQKQIYVYCYYLLQQSEGAEDAVQDIFMKAYVHIQTYSKEVSFSAWLYKIAYNHCMNLNKKRYRDIDMLHRFKKAYSSDVLNTRDELLDSDRVESLLRSLTFQEKNLLLMRALEDYSYEEIGQVLNVTPSAARKKMERIRKKLMKKRAEGGVVHDSILKSTR